MKEVILNIIPMNCGTGTALNTIATFDEAEYTNAADRKILYYDPFLSKFKLKSGSAQPYLEPSLFGAKKGDIVEVEFEALSIGEKATTVMVTMGDLCDTATGTGLTATSRDTQILYFDHGDYRKYKLNLFVTDAFNSAMLGLFLNLRVSTINTEVVLKNVRIKYKTSNDAIEIKQDYTTCDTATDFKDFIVNKMQRRDKFVNYTPAYTSYINGETVIDNTGMTVTSANTNVTGLAHRLKNKINPTCQAVYLEIINNGNTNLKSCVVQCKINKTTGVSSTTVYNTFPIPVAVGVVQKKVIYLPMQFQLSTHADLTGFDLTEAIIEVTGKGNDGSFRIQKVIFGEITHASVKKNQDAAVSSYADYGFIAKQKTGLVEMLVDSANVTTSIAAGATLSYEHTFSVPFQNTCSFATAIDFGPNVNFSFNVDVLLKNKVTILIKNNSASAATPYQIGIFAVGV